MTVAAERHLEAFLAALRQAGLPVPPARAADFLRALTILPLGGPGDLYWAARLTLLTRIDDRAAFDAIFQQFWGDSAAPGRAVDDPAGPAAGPRRRDGQGTMPPFEIRQGEGTGRAASADDLVGPRRLAQLAPHRRAWATALARAVPRFLPMRRRRRARPARRGLGIDQRATLRRALRTGGEPLVLARRARPLEPRKLLIAIDISGSMKAQIEPALLLAHAILRATPRVAAYTLGSRLTRITQPLEIADPDRALAATAALVADLEGGTRLGDTLHRVLARRRHGETARGAVVLVLSDGLERGDPAPLAQAVERLARRAFRLVWLTPLMRGPGWRPQTRAMQALAPWLDRLLPAAGPDDLARALAALPAIARARRRQPFRQPAGQGERP